MSRRRIAALAAAGALVLGLLVWGVPAIVYAAAHETTDDAQVDTDVVTVTSKIAERVDAIVVDTNQPVRKGQLLIRLDDRDERRRLAQQRATLAAQRASAGAAAVTVDYTRETQSAQHLENGGGVRSARASVVSATRQLAGSATQVEIDRASLAQTQAQRNAAAAALPAALAAEAKARDDFARSRELLGNGDVSAAQFEADRSVYVAARSQAAQARSTLAAADAAARAARARVEASLINVRLARAAVDAQNGSLSTAQGRLRESDAPSRIATQAANAQAVAAQVETALENVRSAEDQLGYTEVRSPIDGTIGQKAVEVGASVAPGQSLLTIIPAHKLFITANYKETQIERMRLGADADVRIDAYPHRLFHGRVVALGPASQNTYALVPAQNASGNFVKVTQRIPVRIAVDADDPQAPLRPGMSAVPSVRVR